MGLVHVKSLQGARQLQQVINQQIASESWRGAKNGGEAEGDAVGLFQDGILASLLGLAVQRSRVARGVLVADSLDGAVAGAGRGVDDALLGAEPLDQLFDAGLVQGQGHLGLLLAGGEADDGSQVNDDVMLLDKGLVSWGIQNITLDDGQILM